MNSPIYATASQLAQMIHDHTLTSVALLEAQLTQIAKHNLKLNAIGSVTDP